MFYQIACMINNYGLFDKYLNKVKTSTVSKFGSLEQVQAFLYNLAEQGNVLLAIRVRGNLKLSPIDLAKLIKSDRYLAKCVELAQTYTAEVVEAVLYDRAINGYEELTFNADGQCITRKKKYCSKSLLEYLKANSPKYRSNKYDILSKNLKGRKSKVVDLEANQSTETIPSFEIESYEQGQETVK